jgi:hypothetical protein
LSWVKPSCWKAHWLSKIIIFSFLPSSFWYYVSVSSWFPWSLFPSSFFNLTFYFPPFLISRYGNRTWVPPIFWQAQLEDSKMMKIGRKNCRVLSSFRCYLKNMITVNY